MGRFKDYTGETIGNFTIIKELGNSKIIYRCNLCGKEKESKKYDIVRGRQQSCGCLNYKDYTGQTIGNFTILKELGHSRIFARCNLCGKEKEFYKRDIVRGTQQSCGCLNFKDYTGQTVGNFTILKELGNSRIFARCNLCGKEKEFNKNPIISKKNKSCGCLYHTKYIDYTGQTIGNFTIIEELGKNRIIARCNLCGKEKEFYKSPIIRKRIKSCGCILLKVIDYTGHTLGNFTILKELGKGKVFARCNICGTEKEFDKPSIISKSIKSCGCLPTRNDYKNRVFKDYKFLNFEYKGRNGEDYFLVENIQTKEQEVLTTNEILERNN